MNEEQNYSEQLILALQRKEVALWLGENWIDPKQEQEKKLLAEQDWYGIWANSKSPTTAAIIKKYRPDNLKHKYFVEVPDEMFLSLDFEYSNYCPYFYINGCSSNSSEFGSIKRIQFKLEKFAQLERLGSASLLMCGFGVEGFVNNLGEYYEFLKEIEDIYVIGFNYACLTNLESQNIPSWILGKIKPIEESIFSILKKYSENEESEDQLSSRCIIARRGENDDIKISLDDLLKTNPPLDQFFYIITENDIKMQSAREKEEKSALIRNMLKNQNPCWRAYSNQFYWKRPIINDLKIIINEKIDKLKKSKTAEVISVGIAGETCSGLSTTLQLLAHYAAEKEKCPTIFSRDTYKSIKSDILLNFISLLDCRLADEKCNNIPLVIVIDSNIYENDATGDLNRLAGLLKRDSRRVLLITGLSANNGVDGKKIRNNDHLLKSILDEEEITSLCSWARSTGIAGEEEIATIQDWQNVEPEIPLLAALNYIITDDLHEPTSFSNRLTRRLINELSKTSSNSNEYINKNRVPTILIDGKLTKITFGMGDNIARIPTKQNIAEVLTIITAIGGLRAMIPLSVIEAVANINAQTLRKIISILEKSNLIKSDMLEKDSRLKPRSYYGKSWSTGLLHNLYASLLESSLSSGDLGAYLEVGNSELCVKFLRLFKNIDLKSNDEIPIALLGPICQSLKPGQREHIEYAEWLSVEYLRISYDDNENSRKSIKLKEKINEIIQIYHKYLPRTMLDDSDTLLHSYALSCRWYIPLLGNRLKNKSIVECHEIYDKAENSLIKALDLVKKKVGSEAPENLKTSLGLVYRNRAITEINHPDGQKDNWEYFLNKARNCFEEVLPHSKSTYVNHAIADMFIRELEIHFHISGPEGYQTVPPDRLSWFGNLEKDDVTHKLKTIIWLLSVEPESRFEAKWNDTKKRAFKILLNTHTSEAIEDMKQSRDEIGYALDAIRQLKDIKNSITMVPQNPTKDVEEKKHIDNAINILNKAKDNGIKPTDFGNLLRYALYSALPENTNKYKERYRLIRELKKESGQLAYNEPVWLYDYAMLAFQNGDISEGQNIFSKLRQNGLFRKVSYERNDIWKKSPEYKVPIEGELKITSLEQYQNKDRGWGEFVRNDNRDAISGAIPFRISSFITQRPNLKVGDRIQCKIKLQSSGAYAIPLQG